MAKSRQQIAKETQGYIPKFVPKNCSTCEYFEVTKEKRNEGYGDYIKETDIRCGFGNFVVKKQGVCNKHKFKKIKNV